MQIELSLEIKSQKENKYNKIITLVHIDNQKSCMHCFNRNLISHKKMGKNREHLNINCKHKIKCYKYCVHFFSYILC